MTRIGIDDVIVRKADRIETELDDEIIVMNVASGEIVGLADIAKEIWAALGEPVAFGALVARLTATFAVTPAVCSEEVGAFLAELEQAGVVEIKGAA
jgi:hypothetical protein